MSTVPAGTGFRGSVDPAFRFACLAGRRLHAGLGTIAPPALAVRRNANSSLIDEGWARGCRALS